MGERGEGSELWPPFSVTGEPCSSLSGVESKGIESVCPFFVHQVLLAEGKYSRCFLEPASLWNMSQNLLWIYLPNSPCVVDHSS